MRLAHLILAHKGPAQLERLLTALDHPGVDCYIHLDQKTDIRPFLHLGKRERVFFLKNRIKVFWAKYSMVQAVLNGLSEILGRGQYAYINVMSGQDFPLKPADQVYEYLVNHRGMEFITCIKETDGDPWWPDAIRHVWRYNLENWRIPGKYRIEGLANWLVSRNLLPKRRFPLPNYVVAGRSQWFTITSGAATYLLDFLKNNPSVVRFFKYVWGADEFVFATVLYNSTFGERTAENLQFIDWSGGKANPKMLGGADFDAMIASGKLFARKFDLEADPEIITRLEGHIRVSREVSPNK